MDEGSDHSVGLLLLQGLLEVRREELGACGHLGPLVASEMGSNHARYATGSTPCMRAVAMTVSASASRSAAS